jgi:hypothetical protein
MGQNLPDSEQADTGQPICTHQDAADAPQLTLGRSLPGSKDQTDLGSVTVGINEIYQFAQTMDERFFEIRARAIASGEEARFTEDEDRRLKYSAKPWYVWFPAGLAAVLLFFLQHYVYLHDEAWRAWCGPLTGFVRLGLMLLGAYCAFTAWPWRRLAGETPEERARLQSARYSFIDRFRKH